MNKKNSSDSKVDMRLQKKVNDFNNFPNVTYIKLNIDGKYEKIDKIEMKDRETNIRNTNITTREALNHTKSTHTEATKNLRETVIKRGEIKKEKKVTNLITDDHSSKSLPYKCDICSKTFLNLNRLINHTIIHYGEMKELSNAKICHMCGQLVTGSMEHHLVSHSKTTNKIYPSGEKTYICKVCAKAFKNMLAFQRHEKLHIDGKPHVCYKCNQAFRCPEDLQKHRKTHIRLQDQGLSPKINRRNKPKHTGTEQSMNLKEQISISSNNLPRVTSNSTNRLCAREKTVELDKISNSKEQASIRNNLLSSETPENITAISPKYSKYDDQTEESLKSKQELVSSDKEILQWDDDDNKTEVADKAIQAFSDDNTTTGAKKLVKCELCLQYFKTGQNLRYHISRVHKKERPYKCDQCGKDYQKKRNLEIHMSEHSAQPKPYKCDVCSKTFAHQAKLDTHIRCHYGEMRKINNDKSSTCHICGKTVKGGIKLHLLIHSDERHHKCTLCDKAYKTKSQLTGHMVIHSDAKNYLCHVCAKTFKDKSTLKKHLKLHTNCKPHSCSICDKAFTYRCNLLQHMRVHKNLELTKDMKTHSDAKNFLCHVCEKSFKDKRDLHRHEKWHVDGKLHVCNICNKTFTYQTNLQQHRKIHSRLQGQSLSPKINVRNKSLHNEQTMNLKEQLSNTSYNLCTTRLCAIDKTVELDKISNGIKEQASFPNNLSYSETPENVISENEKFSNKNDKAEVSLRVDVILNNDQTTLSDVVETNKETDDETMFAVNNSSDNENDLPACEDEDDCLEFSNEQMECDTPGENNILSKDDTSSASDLDMCGSMVGIEDKKVTNYPASSVEVPNLEDVKSIKVEIPAACDVGCSVDDTAKSTEESDKDKQELELFSSDKVVLDGGDEINTGVADKAIQAFSDDNTTTKAKPKKVKVKKKSQM